MDSEKQSNTAMQSQSQKARTDTSATLELQEELSTPDLTFPWFRFLRTE